MFCDKCGKEIKGNERFCTRCGNEISAKERRIVSDQPESKHKKKRLVAMGAVSVALLCLAVILLFDLKDKENQNNVKNETRFEVNVESLEAVEDEVLEEETIESEIQKRYMCTEETHWAESSSESENPMMYQKTFEYDEYGNVILEKCYIPEYDSEVFREYEYDEHGRKISDKTYYADGIVESIIRYEYDTAGNMIRESDYIGEDVLEMYIDYIYDEKGNVINKRTFLDNGELYSEIKYMYDANNRHLREEHIYMGDLNRIVEYSYTESIEKAISYGKDGVVFSTEERIYDDSGNLYEELHYANDRNNTIVWQQHFYNEENNEVKMIDMESGKTYNYLYDKNGNLVSKELENADATYNLISSYEYELFEIIEY